MITEIKLSVIGIATGIGTVGNVAMAVVTEPIQLGILTLIGTAITATATVVLGFMQRRNNVELKEARAELKQLKENTDGKLTELMKAASRADRAEAKEEGKAEAKLEAKADAPVTPQAPPTA